MAAEAFCATHADVSAVAVCDRCGSFLCRTCLVFEAPPQCAGCHAKWWGALGRQPFSLGLVISEGLRLLRERIGVCLALAVATTLVGRGFRWLSSTVLGAEVASFDGLFELVLQTAAIGIWVPVLRDALTGQQRPWADRFTTALRSLPRLLWARLRYLLLTAFGLMLLIVPGVSWGSRYLLVEEVALLEEGPVFARAGQLGQYQFWSLVGLFLAVTGLQIGLPVSIGAISVVLTRLGPSSSAALAAWSTVVMVNASEVVRLLLNFTVDAVLVCCWASLSQPPQSPPVS
jgi:hypothetical protein